MYYKTTDQTDKIHTENFSLVEIDQIYTKTIRQLIFIFW